MIYRAIGLMSGSSLDGLDIAFVEFTETGGKWVFEILAADCIAYDEPWTKKLQTATTLSALDYQLLHTEYGHYVGEQVNQFIEQHRLHHKVHLIASHGHTTFHIPAKKITAQLGDGAAIAAETKLPVVSDLRALDVAFGGQGAPIVPVGEKLLFEGYDYFLNLGGIANISIKQNNNYTAFDVCAANRVLNMLAAETGAAYDDGGKLAARGTINEAMLAQLNALDYYGQPAPKSLANSFGTEIVYPLVKSFGATIPDALRTYTEHICEQVVRATTDNGQQTTEGQELLKLLVTGGGAFNTFLIERLSDLLKTKEIEVVVPDENTVRYKEAVIMALIGILRWREEATTFTTVTGASQSSIGGTLWLGNEA